MLPGGIVYADLARLSLDQLDSLFSFQREAKAWVFDLRGYPDFSAYVIGPRMSEDWETTVSQERTPFLHGPVPLSSEVLATTTTMADVARMIDSTQAAGPKLQGPVVALVDERTQSRGEWSAQILRAAGAVLIGTETSGVNGDITFSRLPGDLLLRFSGKEILGSEGETLQRNGLFPDHRVPVTLEFIRRGEDPVVARAIAVLATEQGKR
jgi:hypothetical protein